MAIVNVPIFLPGGRPFGLLQVDAREARQFDDGDIEFLRSYCTVLSAAIDRLQTAVELGQSNERFRLIVEHAHDHAIILCDPQVRIAGWFAGATAIFGWTEEAMIGQSIGLIFTSENRANDVSRREAERAAKNGTAPNVRWHVGKGGRRVFLDGQRIALRKEDGTIRGFLKIAPHTTERRRGEERQSLLYAELQHRVRNILAVIASIVNRGDGRGTGEELKKALSGRISAMAARRRSSCISVTRV
jgi:PAS domain S-box-containing protein